MKRKKFKDNPPDAVHDWNFSFRDDWLRINHDSGNTFTKVEEILIKEGHDYSSIRKSLKELNKSQKSKT